MTVISAYVDLFVRGKCGAGGMSGGNCPNTHAYIHKHIYACINTYIVTYRSIHKHVASLHTYIYTYMHWPVSYTMYTFAKGVGGRVDDGMHTDSVLFQRLNLELAQFVIIVVVIVQCSLTTL